jgi:urease accessory protein
MLPIGAYQYSQGLEHAVQCGWIGDRTDALKWISELLHHTISHIDLPIIHRAHRAWSSKDTADLRYWDDVCRSHRETRELRDEEDAMGIALMRLAAELDQPIPKWRPGYVVAFSVFAVNAGITGLDALKAIAGFVKGIGQIADSIPENMTTAQNIEAVQKLGVGKTSNKCISHLVPLYASSCLRR